VLTVPPLRERLDDIPVLIGKFLAEFGSRHQLTIPDIDNDLYAFLSNRQWPGNIRQLRHEVERAVIFCKGNRLRTSDFQSSDFPHINATPSIDPIMLKPEPTPIGDLQGALDSVETNIIREALLRYKGNKKKVAEELGISRSYLYKKLGVS
jgi:DNA-binding NtrC family response regulator